MDDEMEVIEEIKPQEKDSSSTALEIWGDTTCIFCKRNLLESKNDPKLLTCLHAACSECVQNKSSNESISCDGCSQTCQLNEIIEHQFVCELKQGANNSNENDSENITCSCADNEEVSSYCDDCQDWLCDQCVSAHQRVRFTKDHVIRKKEDKQNSDKEGQSLPGQTRYLQCPTHKQELLKLYCESCEKLTCRDCQLVEHKDHKYQFLSSISHQYKQFLTTLLTKIKEKSTYIESAQQLVKKRQSEILVREDEVTKEIKMFAVQIITLINQRGKQLLQELHETCEKKKEQLVAKNEELVNLSLKLEHCLKFADSAVKESSDSALVYSKKLITNQLRHVLHRRCEVPNPQHVVDIRFMYDNKYLPEYINKVGQIVVDQQSNSRNQANCRSNSANAQAGISYQPKPPPYTYSQQQNHIPNQSSPQRRPSPPVAQANYNPRTQVNQNSNHTPNNTVRGVPAQGFQSGMNKQYTPRNPQNMDPSKVRQQNNSNYISIRPRTGAYNQRGHQPNLSNQPHNSFQQHHDSSVRILNVQSLQSRNTRQSTPQVNNSYTPPKVISVTSMSTNQQPRPNSNISLSMTNTQRLSHFPSQASQGTDQSRNSAPRMPNPSLNRVSVPSQVKILELGKRNSDHVSTSSGMILAKPVDAVSLLCKTVPKNQMPRTNLSRDDLSISSLPTNYATAANNFVNKMPSNFPTSMASSQMASFTKSMISSTIVSSRVQTPPLANLAHAKVTTPELVDSKEAVKMAISKMKEGELAKVSIANASIDRKPFESSTSQKSSCAFSKQNDSKNVDRKPIIGPEGTIVSSAASSMIQNCKNPGFPSAIPNLPAIQNESLHQLTKMKPAMANVPPLTNSQQSIIRFGSLPQNQTLPPVPRLVTAPNYMSVHPHLRAALNSPNVPTPHGLQSGEHIQKIQPSTNPNNMYKMPIGGENSQLNHNLPTPPGPVYSPNLQLRNSPHNNLPTPPGSICSPSSSYSSHINFPYNSFNDASSAVSLSSTYNHGSAATSIVPNKVPITTTSCSWSANLNKVNPKIEPLEDSTAFNNLEKLVSKSLPFTKDGTMNYGSSWTVLPNSRVDEVSLAVSSNDVKTSLSSFTTSATMSSKPSVTSVCSTTVSSKLNCKQEHLKSACRLDSESKLSEKVIVPPRQSSPSNDDNANIESVINVLQTMCTEINESLDKNKPNVSQPIIPASEQTETPLKDTLSEIDKRPIKDKPDVTEPPTSTSEQTKTPMCSGVQKLIIKEKSGLTELSISDPEQTKTTRPVTSSDLNKRVVKNELNVVQPSNSAVKQAKNLLQTSCSEINKSLVKAESDVIKPTISSPDRVKTPVQTSCPEDDKSSVTDKPIVTQLPISAPVPSSNAKKFDSSRRNSRSKQKNEDYVTKNENCNAANSDFEDVPSIKFERQLSVALFDVTNKILPGFITHGEPTLITKQIRREMRRRERVLRKKEKLQKVRRKRHLKSSFKGDSDNSDAEDVKPIKKIIVEHQEPNAPDFRTKRKLSKWDQDPDWKNPENDCVKFLKRPSRTSSPKVIKTDRKIRQVHENLDKMICNAIKMSHRQGVSISKEIIMSKAKQLSDDLGIEKFVCDDHWYEDFVKKDEVSKLFNEESVSKQGKNMLYITVEAGPLSSSPAIQSSVSFIPIDSADEAKATKASSSLEDVSNLRLLLDECRSPLSSIADTDKSTDKGEKMKVSDICENQMPDDQVLENHTATKQIVDSLISDVCDLSESNPNLLSANLKPEAMCK